MKNIKKMSIALVAVIVMLLAFSAIAFAEPAEAEAAGTVAVSAEAVAVQAESSLKTVKAISAGACVAIAAAVGALSMGFVVTKASDGTARQPEAAGKIQTMMMMGLVFIETAIIYALIVAILIIFVL